MQEFSKKLAMGFLWVFVLQIVLTVGAHIYMGNDFKAVELFEACVPVYMTVFGGYYGKAAFENGKKITASKACDAKTDNSNG